jgi:glycosyltransferase involved in cell wall biosynthesis
MKVVFDARWIFDELSGVGIYAMELLRQLSRIDKQNLYVVVFENKELMKRMHCEVEFRSNPNFEFVVVPYGLFSFKNQLFLPLFLKKTGADVYHSPNYMIPFMAFPRRKVHRIACVVTVHDVIPLVLPAHAPRSRKSRLFFLYKLVMYEVGKRADAIIAVSNVSRSDILRYLHIPEGVSKKVRTIYNGVNEMFREAGMRRNVQKEAKEGEKTILYVGRRDPYKNLTGLIKAFSIAKQMCPFELKLDVVGPDDPRYPEARELAEELGVVDAIKWHGYINNEQLMNFYLKADLLVQPSLYEGFGLPVVEAMACGLPVVCTDGGALPEIVGDAGIIVHTDDTEAMAKAIVDVLTHPEVSRQLSEKGIKRSSIFSWKMTAMETIKLYSEVVSGGLM